MQNTTSVHRLDPGNNDDLTRFIRVPRSEPIQALYEPYRGIWCPYTDDTLRQTLSPKNPIYEHTDEALFVASRGGVEVGRVAAFHNPLSSLNIKEKLGFFGFFEAADEDATRALLFEGVWPYLKSLGDEGMVGNINPTTNDEVGVLIEGFQRHVMLLEFNPPDYPRFFEAIGFTKVKDVFSFTAKITPELLKNLLKGKTDDASVERMIRIMCKRSDITIETLNKREVAKMAHEFCMMYNRAWADHWGFEPFTAAELLYLTADLLKLLPSDLIIIARNKEGKPVGAALCIPDLNTLFRTFDGRFGVPEIIKAVSAMWAPKWMPIKNRPKMLRIVALGVLPEYDRKGAAAAIMLRVVQTAKKFGFEEASVSWILEDNEPMLAVPKRFGLTIEQRWRIYGYRLDGASVIAPSV